MSGCDAAWIQRFGGGTAAAICPWASEASRARPSASWNSRSSERARQRSVSELPLRGLLASEILKLRRTSPTTGSASCSTIRPSWTPEFLLPCSLSVCVLVLELCLIGFALAAWDLPCRTVLFRMAPQESMWKTALDTSPAARLRCSSLSLCQTLPQTAAMH